MTPLEVVKQYKKIAVVGISAKESRASHIVAKYLLDNGFDVIPVNPVLNEVLGLKCYPDLKSCPEPEIIDIFRSPDAVIPIVDEAITIGAKVIWMQEGIINEEAAKKARGAGLYVVMNMCIKKVLQGTD